MACPSASRDIQWMTRKEFVGVQCGLGKVALGREVSIRRGEASTVRSETLESAPADQRRDGFTVPRKLHRPLLSLLRERAVAGRGARRRSNLCQPSLFPVMHINMRVVLNIVW